MAIRIVTTHIWTKIFIPIIWISRLVCICVVLSLLGTIIPAEGFGIVIFIVAFLAIIVTHAMTIEQWYHVVQTYLYIRINLATAISLHEAKHLLLLFAPTDEGRWYPMSGIRELPKEYRRQVLLDSARKIYSELGYQFGLEINEGANGHGATATSDYNQYSSRIPIGFKHLVAMLCEMAKGDGRITKEEIDVIDSFFIDVLELSPNERQESIDIFKGVKDSDIPFEVYAREFYKLHSDNKKLLEGVVGLLLNIAYADGELSSEEAILLNQVIEIFGVGASDYEERKAAQEQQAKSKNNRQDSYYAKILGLDGNITLESVKSAYRKLAAQYHPDKVSHLGSRIREVAESEMKKINEAYEYFQKKFGM